ncbi:thr operon leader peptide [Providencia sp.]|uniref:thr operon leader peptide n=1 Tax=Providencia sp. TaxID=589 RepID=UPI000E8998C2|nr:thr operon leader peptide [Providencia sp.]
MLLDDSPLRILGFQCDLAQINLTYCGNCFNRIGRNLMKQETNRIHMRNFSLTTIIITTTVTTGNGAG